MRLMMLTVLAAMALATAAPPKPPAQEIKSPAPPDGAALFRAYCASCHGEDGKGGGPVASNLLMKPGDLTTLKQRNRGEFPAYRVRRMLDGSDDLPAHGNKRMPVWGPGLAADKATAILRRLEAMQK